MEPADCHPIRPGVLFECFVNPDRIDIAADYRLMSACRHKVVEKVSAFCAPARKLAARASNWRRGGSNWHREASNWQREASCRSFITLRQLLQGDRSVALAVALQGQWNTQQFSFVDGSARHRAAERMPLPVRKSSTWNGLISIGPASCEGIRDQELSSTTATT